MHKKIVEASLSFKEALAYCFTNKDDFSYFDNTAGVNLFDMCGGQDLFLQNIIDALFPVAIEDEGSQFYLSQLFVEWNEQDAQYELTDLATKLIRQVIARFAESYCTRLIYDETFEDEIEGRVRKVFNDFINIINNTYEKYETLYNILQSNKDTLMRKVEASSTVTNRFNDTPQEAGNFEDEDHTTEYNITRGNTGTDDDTPIARIDEIDRKMKHLILRWTNEFRYLFWEE